jgi:hypothetical protein
MNAHPVAMTFDKNMDWNDKISIKNIITTQFTIKPPMLEK